VEEKFVDFKANSAAETTTTIIIIIIIIIIQTVNTEKLQHIGQI